MVVIKTLAKDADLLLHDIITPHLTSFADGVSHHRSFLETGYWNTLQLQ